jgi:hypothetical protein
MDFTARLEATMRLIQRHRHVHRSKAPRIEISQAEISADLHYPLASSRPVQRAVLAARRGGGR